jgi:hypothetical protein
MNAITFEIGLMSLVRSSNFDENFKITRLDDKTLKALVREKQHIVTVYYVYWGNKELIYF